ncbi:MAG: hypothetical protein AVDCRST_MAG28-2100 [uncultured Rubrobacteraceae bacterium]|uniref:Uncharacterized protein n=1 Tax=uncultured Rubrobacteraceae bacterium TaxID=349277 RepID=A0A6J4R2N5_9ACTN|nr:MAG: hypothetical protein AVDCRST_MAG28-2100 [uncultured Rubrobacteraceae bacterium]
MSEINQVAENASEGTALRPVLRVRLEILS